MQQISFQETVQTTTAAPMTPGSRATTPDGREWVYVRANEALVKGAVAVPVPVTAVGTGNTSSVDGAGRTTYITNASATWTPGAYAGGYVLVNGGTGSGQYAKIRDNTNNTLTLAAETPLTIALSASDSTLAIWNQFLIRNAVVTSKIQNATGGAQTGFNALDYGWVLSRGIGVAIADSALTVGKSFTTGSASVAGQVIPGTTGAGDFDQQALGICVVANSGANLGALVEYHLS